MQQHKQLTNISCKLYNTYVLRQTYMSINIGRHAINYSRLLTTLKAELPETVPKKPRNAKKNYPTKAQ